MKNMNKKRLFGQTLAILAIAISVGCGGDDNPAAKPNNNGVTTDAGTNNESDGMTDPDVDCFPTVTECLASACGMVSDGCGDVLDCGACTCEAGEPIQAECGPCNLGRIECSSDTEGSCVVPDVIDGKACEDILFVEAGAVGGDGTASLPFGTLSSAISAAQSGDVILVAKASTPYTETIVLKDGVSISGAWNRQSKWIYDEDVKAEFQVPAPSNADVVGLSGDGLSGSFVVENLKVKTDNASPGFNNYGFLGVEITGLIARRLEIRTGTGGIGLDGVEGQAGAAGSAGGDAALWGSVTCGSTSLTVQDGGAAGANGACSAGNGGAGGGGMITSGPQIFPAAPGSIAAQGTAGGIAGIQVSNRESGGPGASGVPFVQGAQNGTRSQAFGEVVGDRWVVTADGAMGANGLVGSGGGGGGGAAANPSVASGRAKTYGAAGGGGGAGGCGGTGGSGGTGGGGSFALFLSGGDFAIENSEFTSGLGGSGGRGGPGASGGSGGQGGRGLSVLCGVGVFVGGDGGAGANGQSGGSGAGGAGGVSYGGYCYQARVTMVDVSFDSLGAGLGGAGGTGAESGNTGESFDQYRCE